MTDLSGRSIGPYFVLQKISRGGMAVVYRVKDLRTQDIVALKLMAPNLIDDSQYLARFEREVSVLSKLSHPHIVPILDFGEFEGSPYIVMPHMSSGTLQDRLKERPLSAAEGAKLNEQISSALQYAHDRGVVHRDVKTTNILIDTSGNASLSDFGLAIIQDVSISLTGSGLIGTPAYMSPEQCLGEKVDSRSDQYSFALVMYRVATGKLPYEGDTPLALAMKQINEALPLPRKVNPNLPEAVEAVLLKALAKKPEQRFQSMAEYDEAFQWAISAVVEPGQESIPPPIYFDLETLPPDRETEEKSQKGLIIGLRKPAAIGGLVAILVLSLAAVAYGALNNSSGWIDSGVRNQDQSPDLQSTVDTLFTQNAPLSALGEDVIGTAVAATMSVLIGDGTTDDQQAQGLMSVMKMGTGTPTGDEIPVTGGELIVLTPTGGLSTNSSPFPTTVSDSGDPTAPSPGVTETTTETVAVDPTASAVPTANPTATAAPPTATPQPPTATAVESTLVPTEAHPHCEELPTRNPNYCPPEP